MIRKVSGVVTLVMLIVVVGMLFVGQQPADQTLLEQQRQPEPGESVNSCQSDDDCILVESECCSCERGGTKQAINRAFYSHVLQEKNDRCVLATCSSQSSTDRSCQTNQVKCVANRCQVD